MTAVLIALGAQGSRINVSAVGDARNVYRKLVVGAVQRRRRRPRLLERRRRRGAELEWAGPRAAWSQQPWLQTPEGPETVSGTAGHVLAHRVAQFAVEEKPQAA